MGIIDLIKDWKTVVMVIIIILSTIFVILEVFGVFHSSSRNTIIQFIRRKEGALTLTLLVSTSLMTIAIYGLMKQVDEREIQIEKNTKSISDKINLVNELKNIRNDFDPLLDSLFRNDMNEKIEFFDDAINSKRYSIYDKKKFSSAYSKTFRMFPKSHIMATSLADSTYFWTATGEEMNQLEKEIQSFIKDGGKMTRIFYLDDKTKANPRTQRVLDRQMEIGVIVYTIDKKQTNKQLFVLYENMNFGWLVDADPDDKSQTKFQFTRNSEDLSKFREEFDNIMHADGCYQCKK